MISEDVVHKSRTIVLDCSAGMRDIIINYPGEQVGPGPEIFVARGNNGRGPGTTANPVNTQFCNLGRLSWPKRDETNAYLNFPPFFCQKNRVIICFKIIFFQNP